METNIFGKQNWNQGIIFSGDWRHFATILSSRKVYKGLGFSYSGQRIDIIGVPHSSRRAASQSSLNEIRIKTAKGRLTTGANIPSYSGIRIVLFANFIYATVWELEHCQGLGDMDQKRRQSIPSYFSRMNRDCELSIFQYFVLLIDKIRASYQWSINRLIEN